MARLKPSVKKIESLDDANGVLQEIGLLEIEYESIDNDAQKQIAVIKAGAKKAGDKVRERVKELSALLGAYAEYNRAELFKDAKSVTLPFGTFGYRQSTTLTCKADTVELLKKFGFTNCVRVKEEPDKDAMKALDDETLAQVDAARKTRDAFFCEADRERVNADLLKEEL